MKTLCEVLGVVRLAVAVKRARSSGWRHGRRARVTNDAALVEEIQAHVAHLPPTATGVSGRCCAAPAGGKKSGGMTVALPWTAATPAGARMASGSGATMVRGCA